MILILSKKKKQKNHLFGSILFTFWDSEKPTYDIAEANATITSDCLVRFDVVCLAEASFEPYLFENENYHALDGTICHISCHNRFKVSNV